MAIMQRGFDDFRNSVDRNFEAQDKKLEAIDVKAGALVIQRPDGSVEAKPGGFDWKLAVAIAAGVTTPLAVAIISTGGAP